MIASTCYPPTLVMTAERDDRVVPWHSYKFAAALQAAQVCDHPILLRVETRAGHRDGKPVWMQIEDFADQWAFLVSALNMELPSNFGQKKAVRGSRFVVSQIIGGTLRISPRDGI